VRDDLNLGAARVNANDRYAHEDRHGRSGRESEPHGRVEDDDVLNETILAVDLKESDSIGCAYYIALDETLFLQEDLAMAGSDFVETLIMHAQPTTILVSSKAPESLVTVLEAGSQGLEEVRRGQCGTSKEVLP
jgi:hypothetical protein